MSARFSRAVVTGGAGFLGSHLCEQLLRRGTGVLCLDNFLTGTPANVAHLIGEPRFQVIKCDVTNFVHVAGEPLSVTGDGSQTRSVCYVDDTIRGILALAESDAAGPVNIGAPYELSIAELAETIIALSGSAESIRYVERPVDDPRVRRPDIALAWDLLGWQPQVLLAEGLTRTIGWFRSELPATAGVVPDSDR